MTTSIGHRWKGGNVRSRVVLIARWACATRPPQGGRTNLFFYFSVHRKEDPCLPEENRPIIYVILRRRPVRGRITILKT